LIQPVRDELVVLLESEDTVSGVFADNQIDGDARLAQSIGQRLGLLNRNILVLLAMNNQSRRRVARDERYRGHRFQSPSDFLLVWHSNERACLSAEVAELEGGGPAIDCCPLSNLLRQAELQNVFPLGSIIQKIGRTTNVDEGGDFA